MDTNNHMTSVDHVKINSWCKFGECSTQVLYNLIDLTISIVTQACNVDQGNKPPRDISRSCQD